MAHRSFKQVQTAIYRMQENKINSGYSNTFITNFRRKFNVLQNIQYLIFGQYIPVGGFKTDEANRQMTFKTIKTADLREQRQEELDSLDDAKQMQQARQQHQLSSVQYPLRLPRLWQAKVWEARQQEKVISTSSSFSERLKIIEPA